ncbi:hypothetical protein Dda_7362 [Drechslerella dactyloides]|uniref:DUF7580 domain-containing protein n=1 Tax=Drechslerella dactyloides TaxID=74499 RepID=A0AAD6IWC0_DREDA|nr:hypothetical protein Dda_7362 [Drechslerella dactyloides]
MEVAGLVLGAIPILITAVEGYKKTSRFAKLAIGKRACIRNLANALSEHRVILVEVLWKLHRDSGAKTITHADQELLKSLDDTAIQRHFREYLGEDTYVALIGKLDRSRTTISVIAKYIATLVAGLEVPTDELKKIMQTNEAQKPKQLDLMRRFKTGLREGEIKAAIKELDDAIDSIRGLTDIACENRQHVVDNSPKAKKLAGTLHRVRRLANKLHIAIGRSWRVGCHTKHDTKLFLEDHLGTAADDLSLAKKASLSSSVTFRLVFEAKASPSSTVWHETTVQVMDDTDDFNDSLDAIACSQSSEPRRKTAFAIPDITSPTSDIDMTLIADICAAIAVVKSNNVGVTFIVAGNRQFGFICQEEDTLLPCYFFGSEISLQTLLLSGVPPGFRGPLIPLRAQMLLAFRLALNLLQLLQTRWIQKAWSKDSIYFPISVAAATPDFSRPFVSIQFDDQSNGPAGPPHAVELRMAILELGILLLEIWHLETFEQWCERALGVKCKPPSAENFNIRHMLASAWLADKSNQPLEFYRKATFYCISGIDNGEAGGGGAQGDKTGFWGELCQNVIEPLSQNCRL